MNAATTLEDAADRIDEIASKLAEIERRPLGATPPAPEAPPPRPTVVSQAHSLLYTAREAGVLRVEGEIMQRQLQIRELEKQHTQAVAAFREAQEVLAKEYGFQDGDSFDKLTGVIKRLI